MFFLPGYDLPMTQARHVLYGIERPPRSWIPPRENPLGVSPCALSRAPSVCLGAPKHREGALSSTSPPHKKFRRSCFARAPSRSQFGDSLLRELRLALVSRPGSSKSWLRQPCFETYRKMARKLLMRQLIVVLGLTSHVYRCSLARATGPFSHTVASASLQRPG